LFLAVHFAEEWFIGFPEWAEATLNLNVDATQFLSVNLVGIVVFAFAAIVAYQEPRAAWISVSMATLVSLNTLIHSGLSVAVGVYSPGTVSGWLLYAPVSVSIFWWASNHLSRGVNGWAMALGLIIHGFATLSAIL